MRVKNMVIAGIASAQLLIGGSVAAVSLSSTPASAADNYNPPQQIPSTAQCGSGAASGSFGAFGPGNNFGNSTSGHAHLPGNPNTPSGQGADGPATGANNSGVCGNAP